MARIRSVHPGQWTDEAFVQCSAYARLFALGLRNEADDQGLFEWKPAVMKMRLLPADSVDGGKLLTELEGLDIIRRFTHEGKDYGAIRNFRVYQRPKKPNSIYFMPPEFRTYVGLSDGKSPTSSPPVPKAGEQMKDVGGRVKEERKNSEAKASGDATAPPPTAQLDIPLFLVKPEDGDWSKPLFRQALAWLATTLNTKPDKLRSLLGQWLKLAGGDHKRVFDLIADAQRSAVAEPRAWITAQLGGKNEGATKLRNGFAQLIVEGGV